MCSNIYLAIPWGQRKKKEGGRGGGGGGFDHVSWKTKWPFSHFTDNKLGIWCFKTFLYDQFFLLRLRTTAKELRCSMSSPFSRFLFLVLWKGNRVLCLEVEARHQVLLLCRIIVIRGVVIVFRELVCFNRTVEVIFSLEKLRTTWKKITVYGELDTRFSFHR